MDSSRQEVTKGFTIAEKNHPISIETETFKDWILAPKSLGLADRKVTAGLNWIGMKEQITAPKRPDLTDTTSYNFDSTKTSIFWIARENTKPIVKANESTSSHLSIDQIKQNGISFLAVTGSDVDLELAKSLKIEIKVARLFQSLVKSEPLNPAVECYLYRAPNPESTANNMSFES